MTFSSPQTPKNFESATQVRAPDATARWVPGGLRCSNGGLALQKPDAHRSEDASTSDNPWDALTDEQMEALSDEELDALLSASDEGDDDDDGRGRRRDER